MDTSAEQHGAVPWGAPTEISYEPTAPPFAPPDDRSRAVYRRRLGAVLVIVGFALAAAAQLLPWAAVSVGGAGDGSDLGSSFSENVGMSDGLSLMFVAYLVMWLPALALPAACVFADARRQRIYFACGAAALAAQTLIILPILAKPARLISGASLDQNTLQGDLKPGAFLAVSAVVALAAALVVAVGGRVFPTLNDFEQPAVAAPPGPLHGIPAQPGPNGAEMFPVVDMHAALASSQGYAPERPDIDFGAPAVIGYGGNGARAADVPVDHSMYVRPRSTEQPPD